MVSIHIRVKTIEIQLLLIHKDFPVHLNSTIIQQVLGAVGVGLGG